MRAAVLLLLGLAAVSAVPANPGRIVGGSTTTIQQYPYMVALLVSSTGAWYEQACGGSILNNRSVLSAAHCFDGRSQAWQWRSRVGSTYANSGGTVFYTAQIINHPNYNNWSQDLDLTVLRISGTFTFDNNVRAATIAGANYNVPDNAAVWAAGWGTTCYGCSPSETLRHVQIWAVNLAVCRQRYAELGSTITNNMLCSGWLDVGGRDQCQMDSGGPLIHNNVVVGVCSWGHDCASARYPGVNVRVSAATDWIVANA